MRMTSDSLSRLFSTASTTSPCSHHVMRCSFHRALSLDWACVARLGPTTIESVRDGALITRTRLLSSIQSSRISGNGDDCAMPATKLVIHAPPNQRRVMARREFFTHRGIAYGPSKAVVQSVAADASGSAVVRRAA
jgi:hypothetical protein